MNWGVFVQRQVSPELVVISDRANPLWGAPRVHGELFKLGVEVAQPAVAKYMARGILYRAAVCAPAV
jgi:hypothetical protein